MLDGTYSESADGVTLAFERRMDRPIDKIWAVLTVPERIADWMGEAAIELRVGGRFHLKWHSEHGEMNGVITACDPPSLLEYTWSESGGAEPSRVRWSLEPDGDACRLTLTHTFLKIEGKELIGFAGGWEDLLDAMANVADGVRDFGDHEDYLRLRRGYAEKFGVDDTAPAAA
jgi:uncharacterized protein YndB with AHSA1/START domain